MSRQITRHGYIISLAWLNMFTELLQGQNSAQNILFMWHIAKSLNGKRHIIFSMGFILYNVGSIIQPRTASERKAPVM